VIGTTLGVLAASLIGSAHCAAMCGGFVCFYAGSATPPRDAALLRAHALYNGGRLVSYLILGALAGAIGAGVTQLGVLAGVAQAAAIVAGVLMIVWALHSIAVQRGLRLGSPAFPASWQRTLGGILHRLREQPVGVRAAAMGLLTTLLPCGWLYVFVAAAGGTGGVASAMLVMAAFWLGTVPALLAVGLGAQRVLGPLRLRLPTLSAITVLVIGVLAIAGRLISAGASHGH
jgi:sulfite exporter TauE/SafE